MRLVDATNRNCLIAWQIRTRHDEPRTFLLAGAGLPYSGFHAEQALLPESVTLARASVNGVVPSRGSLADARQTRYSGVTDRRGYRGSIRQSMRRVLKSVARIAGWGVRSQQRKLYEIPNRNEDCRPVQGCPACGSLLKRKTRRRGLSEHLLVALGAQLRRCESCKVRYARIGRSAVYIGDLSVPVARGLAAALGIGVLSAGAAALIVR